MKKYETILMDIDQTLLDFNRAQRFCVEQLLAVNQIPFDEKLYDRYLLNDRRLWHEFELGRVSLQQLADGRLFQVFAEWNERLDPYQLFIEFVELLSSTGFLLDGAYDICQTLSHDVHLLIASNGFARIQEGRLRQAGLRNFFEQTYISEAIGFSKPNRAFFDYILQDRAITDRCQVLMVGDSLSSDIRGGLNADIDTCWLNRRGQINDSGLKPTYVIDNLHELMNIIG